MKALLVFIDGTICDTRPRHALIGTPAFHQEAAVQRDLPAPGSVECLQQLAARYQIVYLGARPAETLASTQQWLERQGFPAGLLFLAETHAQRLEIARDLKEQYDFLAGIGDRWDDNELHGALGCQSFIVKEFAGDWPSLADRVIQAHRSQRVRENRLHLQGKIEGLARVLPLLLSKYGEALWEAWIAAVLEKAAASFDNRREEDLALFDKYSLNPEDLRDAAKLDDLLREDDWEESAVYGLQDFELVEATQTCYVHKVTRCYYAELWRAHGRPDIGYHLHCQTDRAWWDCPAWNPRVRFEQPKTLMQGNDCCVFVQYIPGASSEV